MKPSLPGSCLIRKVHVVIDLDGLSVDCHRIVACAISGLRIFD